MAHSTVVAAESGAPVVPHADYGLFGPDSMTWRVYGFPTSLTVGFQRTALVEMFDPLVVASVAATSSLRQRAADRYDRTLQYAATLVFGSGAAAVEAADTLVRIHARMRGDDQVTGRAYDPNDPAGQLWIHLTQWQSVLHVYERFGPGPLTAEEDRRYWAECATAAAFQTIDPAEVPRNRDEMRAYYDRVRPHLVASPVAVEHARLILGNANEMFSAVPGRWGRLLRPLLAALGRRATVSTLPGWMRGAIGVRQGRLGDAVVRAMVRPVFAFVRRRPQMLSGVLAQRSPLAFPLIAPIVLGIEPTRPVTVSAEAAWAAAGLPTPRERYASAAPGERR